MKNYNDEKLVKNLMNVSWYLDKKDPTFYCWSKLNFWGKSYKAFQNGYYIFATLESDYGYTETEKTHLDNFFKLFNEHMSDFVNLSDLDLKTVKQQVKESRAKSKECGYRLPTYYVVADDKAVAYNPEYMSDCLKFFGDSTAYIYKDGFSCNGGYIKPIFFLSNDGKRVGLLMPVNCYAKGLKKAA